MAYSPRPDLTTVPLRGVEPSHVVLATRADDHSRLLAAFRKSAHALLTDPAGTNQRAGYWQTCVSDGQPDPQ